jgi:WD40 repeat protein
MAFTGSKLFIADIDRIVVADMETGIKIDEIAFADTTVSLNDVFFLDDNTLLVSVINKHELYAINLTSKDIINLSSSNTEGANGLCRYEKKVYICGFSSKEKGKGSIYEYDIETNKLSTVIKELGHLDGIKLFTNKLLVSDWGVDYNHGKIWEIDITTKKARVVCEDEDLKSPSGFDLLDDTLLIPCLDSGTILVYKLMTPETTVTKKQ